MLENVCSQHYGVGEGEEKQWSTEKSTVRRNGGEQLETKWGKGGEGIRCLSKQVAVVRLTRVPG